MGDVIRNRYVRSILATGVAPLALLACSADGVPASGGAQEKWSSLIGDKGDVYSAVRRAEASAPAVSQVLEDRGSLLVTLQDGKHVLGIDAWTAEDGRPVAVEFSQRQDERGGPVISALRAHVVEQHPVDARELADRRRSYPVVGAPARVIAPDLDSLLAVLPEDAPVQALVSLRARPDWTPAARAEMERLEHRMTADATRQRRIELAAQYRSEVSTLQQPMEKRVQQLGGRVVDRFWLGSSLLVEMDAGSLRAISAETDVWNIEPVRKGENEAVDSWEVAVGTQTTQFLDNDFDGRSSNPARHSYSNITLAILDESFEDDTLAFRQNSGTSSRIVSMWDCTTSPCQSRTDLGDGGLTHGTGVAAIAAGDLMDGQDASVTTTSSRRRRSGLSRETGLVLIDRGNDSAGAMRAVNHAGTLAVDGANLSAGFGIDCQGTSALASAVNDLVRVTGTFFTKSAGNSGHSDPNTCRSTDPGAATYSFTVGGTLNSTSGDFNTVRTGPIYDLSSRGGGPYVFGTRTIVATVAPAVRDLVPLPDSGYGDIGSGTSLAAPSVLGTFADFRDWWLLASLSDGFVNHPPNSTAALLLMGDANSESGSPLELGFDELWGNGRFRARWFTPQGMDDPWNWSVGSISISSGSEILVNVNGGAALPSTVNRIKAVIWWPEPNQANGGASGADIVMGLRRQCSNHVFFEDNSYDTKKRVIQNVSVGGNCWALRIRGFNVTPNPWAGGASTRTVYYAYYWEDSARDDADGPAADIQ